MLEKLIAFLIHEAYVRCVRLPPGKYGWTDGYCIVVDLFQDDPITTLIHELIHCVYPTMSEIAVEVMALDIRSRLTKSHETFFAEYLKESVNEAL